MLTIPIGVAPRNQHFCAGAQASLQECTSARQTLSTEGSSDVSHDSTDMQTLLQEYSTSTGETLSMATTATAEERSCDVSHDSNESDNDIFFTPPSSPMLDNGMLVR